MGIDTPQGTSFSSKFSFQHFLDELRVGSGRKKIHGKRSNDEEYSLEEMDQVLLALEKEAELDRSLIE